jgi:hypothetical protein
MRRIITMLLDIIRDLKKKTRILKQRIFNLEREKAMSLYDFFSNVKSLSAFDLQTINTDSVTIGNSISLTGFSKSLFTFQSGVVVSGSGVPGLEHSDDGINWSVVDADFLIEEDQNIIDSNNAVIRLGYIGPKKCVRAIITSSGGANFKVSATVTLGDPRSNAFIPEFNEVFMLPPLDSDLVKWLDASLPSTMNSPFGQPSEWRDPRNNGFKVLQADPEKRFSHGETFQNGLPVMTSNNKFMEELGGIPVSSDNVTIFIVAQSSGTTNSIADLYEVDSGNKGIVFVRSSVSGGTSQIQDRTAIFAGSNAQVLDAGSEDQWNVFYYNRTATAIQAFLNDKSSIAVTLVDPVTRNMDNLTIGKSVVIEFDPLEGFIAEFLVYDRILDSGERLTVRNFLKEKWGTL